MRRLKRTDQLDLFGPEPPMDDRSSMGRAITFAEARQLTAEDSYRIACGEPWPEVLAERRRKRGEDVG